MLLKIKKNKDFLKIYSTGKLYHSKAAFLYALKTDTDSNTRIGISSSKKIKNAVTRNLLRRRTFEILRKLEFKPGFDLVFLIKKRAEIISFYELGKEIINAAESACVLKDKT